MSLLLLFLSQILFSNNISSVKSGNWNQKDVWDMNVVPKSSDQIIINNNINITGNISISNWGRLIVNSHGSIDGDKSIIVENGGELLNYGSINIKNFRNDGNTENYSTIYTNNNFDNNSTLFNEGNVTAHNNVNNNGGTILGFVGYLYSGNNVINNAGGYIAGQSICSIDGKRNPLKSNSGTYDVNTVTFCKQHHFLPVKLLEFEASPTIGQINLEWKTATELNCSFFYILKSLNGIDFENIGTVHSQGNSYEIQEYSFIDTNIKSGTVYYRLTQTDFDGATKIISTTSVKYNNQEINIYPNPTNGIINIDGFDKTENFKIEILTIDGKLVLEQCNSQTQISLEDLDTGIYFVKLINKLGYIETKKIIKR